MTTTINGQLAEWPPDIRRKWDRCRVPPGDVLRSNYFGPRPWKARLKQPNASEGFTCVVLTASGAVDVVTVAVRG